MKPEEHIKMFARHCDCCSSITRYNFEDANYKDLTDDWYLCPTCINDVIKDRLKIIHPHIIRDAAKLFQEIYFKAFNQALDAVYEVSTCPEVNERIETHRFATGFFGG